MSKKTTRAPFALAPLPPPSLPSLLAPYVVKSPPTHLATLWKGAGTAFSLTLSSQTSPVLPCICKVVRSSSTLTPEVIESYQVEQCFYKSGFSELLNGTKVTGVVPSHYLVEELKFKEASEGGKNKKKKEAGKKRKGGSKTQDSCPGTCEYLGSNPRFVTVLSNLSTRRPLEALDLTYPQALSVLSSISVLHGTFAGKNCGVPHSTSPGRSDSTLRGLWDVGGFWCLDRRSSLLSTMCKTYGDELRNRVVKESPTLKDHQGVKDLAKRLKNAAEPLRERLSTRFNPPSWYTLIHGDLKGANIALPSKSDEEDVEQAGLFDFQWTGGGLGVVDLAYFFASALDSEALEREEEVSIGRGGQRTGGER